MAKCGCGGSGCDCKIIGGGGVTVTGAGTPTNPYIITSGANTLIVTDTATLDLTLLGSGTTGDPYTLSGVVAPISMAQLSNVAAAAPTSGQVLIWNSGTSKWTPGPAATATPGLITVGNGLSGDGSAGNALNFKPSPGGRLMNTASGADLTVDAAARLNNSFASAAARTSAIPSPAAGMSGFRVDAGVPEMFDGTTWRPFWLEVGRTWLFPRVSAYEVEPEPAGTTILATGSIVNALAGRYRFDLQAIIAQGAGFNSGTMQLLLGAANIRNINWDTYGSYWPTNDAFVYPHVGGTMALTMRHVNYASTNSLVRDGTQLMVTYLGK